MPFISTKVNLALSREKEICLKEKLGKAIAILPGKTEQFLMLDFEDNCRLYFGGSGENPLAYVEVKIFGTAKKEFLEKLTAEICNILNQELSIAPNHIYVKYEEVAHWGWNGTNF